MINGKKVAVVLPGLNVKGTLERTLAAIPPTYSDMSIFVDDGSTDGCGELAAKLGCIVMRHSKNLGYGAGQKTGYREALAQGADVVVMVHPDFQYKPELMPAMASMVAHGGYDIVLGSRLLVRGALKGGMPQWKYVANRGLTLFENILMGSGLSEFHTGYRAFSRRFLEELPLAENRDDYVFDNEVLAQAIRPPILDDGDAAGRPVMPPHEGHLTGVGVRAPDQGRAAGFDRAPEALLGARLSGPQLSLELAQSRMHTSLLRKMPRRGQPAGAWSRGSPAPAG